MTREEAIAYFKRHIELYCVDGICREAEELAIKALEQEPKWIPLIKRPMTDEEQEYYKEWSDIEGAMMFNCPLPEDGQEVLVSHGGYVYIDTFCEDDGWCDFEGVNIDNVEAWMPLPEPYKAESEE